MINLFRTAMLQLCVFLSLNTHAQLQIVASGPTDLCYSSVTLTLVNPPANQTLQWFAVNGTCFNQVIIPYFNSSTSISASGTGSHFCVATDINGVEQISNTINVRSLPGNNGSPMLPLPYSSNQITCLPSADLCLPYEMAPSGFSSIIKWYRNNAHIAGVTTPFYTATLPGYYKYSVTSFCATSYSDSVLFIPPSSVPQFTTTAVSPLCNGNTINFSATNPIPGANYSWETSNLPSSGFVTSGSGPSFSYIVPSANNLYVRLQCDFGTCALPVSPTVGYTIQNITRQISPSGTQVICQGNSVNLTINVSGGSTTLQWKKNGVVIPGATGTTYAANTAGLYSVDVTASCGVSSSNSVNVVVNSAPSALINASGPTTFCAGGNVSLNANTGSGLTYQWKKYGNNILGATGQSYVATSAGIYKVIVTAPSGCSTASANVTVSVNALPTAAITASGSTAICPGNSVTLNANTGPGLTYQWRKYSNDIVGATNSTYSATGAGQYKVRVTNANGCSKNSNTINVTTLPAPTATITAIGPTSFCQGDSVRLAANTGAGLSYQWKKGSNNISGATVANYYAKVAGNFKVTVTGSNGCVKNSNVIAVSVPCRTANSEQETSLLDNVSLYPNPSNGTFTLELAEIPENGIPMKIYNIFGAQLDSFIAFDKITNYSNPQLASGIYLLSFNQSSSPKVIKFIISK